MKETGYTIGEYINVYFEDQGIRREFYLILNEGNILDPKEADEIKDILVDALKNNIDWETAAPMLEEKNFSSLEFGSTLIERRTAHF